MDVGIYNGLDNSIYQNDSAISRTRIVSFRNSAYQYWSEYINPARPPKKTKEAMRFGSAFHTFILEHNKFNDLYAIEPERVYLNKDGREAYDEYKFKLELLAQTSRTILSQEEYETLLCMRQAIFENNQALDLIEGAIYEQSYFWPDIDSGLMVKARPDILHHNMIVDLKTCKSASTREYQKSMVEGGLHIQGAMVRYAEQLLNDNYIPNVINICIEKTYPYEIGIKIISEDALKAGQVQYQQALLAIRECLLRDKWPSYAIETVDLPAWA